MLTWLEQFLIRYPELALFLVIAAGYWIGSFRIGAFSLGPVTGSLFAGPYQAISPLTITNPNPVTTGMAASVLKVRTKISCFV